MGIFDRIGRLARSEVSELKRVLREAREERELSEADRDELERERLIAEAEAELARAEGDLFADDIERGAAMWSQGGEPAPDASFKEETRHEPRDARVRAFSREVREAYAALELPLGADREAIEAAYRLLLNRYHPDKHARAPHLQRAATELTIRIREARDLLLAWLGGA